MKINSLLIGTVLIVLSGVVWANSADESHFVPHYLGSTFQLYTEIIAAPFPEGHYLAADWVDVSISNIQAIKSEPVKFNDVSGVIQGTSKRVFNSIKSKELISHRSYWQLGGCE